MTITQIIFPKALGQGMVREWLDEGRIMVLRMPARAHREVIDVWFETLIETADQWDTTRPFLALHDIRNMGISYYFRERALELGTRTPKDLRGRVAVVMPKGRIGHLLAKLAKLSLTKAPASIFLEPFTGYDQALEWLREDLETNSQFR